jgi:hypothetical protein
LRSFKLAIQNERVYVEERAIRTILKLTNTMVDKPKRAQPFGLDSFTRTLYENEKNYVANYMVNIVPVLRFAQLLLSMLLFLWCVAAFLLFTVI